ncbi:hypothetical protein BAE44_0015982 [Dichanthelium oligosanthes]|uniref:GATA-type domain-containing protein n=1 Tax=Dichanthelium oligosanthes TaxID=888268 RepID=A0A1E5VCX1_9POAL|nr:hypothetical protein BAE44_0015982 [Dichanthelium oligosanthes]
MRKQSHLSVSDVSDDLPECDGTCVPGGGLCCPDDPLELVLQYFSVPIQAPPSLAAPGIGGSARREQQPLPRKNGFCDARALGTRSAPGGGDVGDVWERDSRGLSSRVPENMEATKCNMSCLTGAVPTAITTGSAHACGASPPSAWTSPASCTSLSCLTPTTSETESSAPVCQQLVWAGPRKRRRPPVMCLKRPWSLEFPLHALPVAPPNDSPGDNNENGNDLSKNTCNNVVGGGICRRRSVPRQRNRQAQRVCSHCHSPDTPQWRAGPDGPGTLCNACGIRYAANKLLPEYRPSTAPSFRSDQHSNRHKKVVKLRKRKANKALEVMHDPVPAPSSSPLSPKSDEFMDVCTHISTDL